MEKLNKIYETAMEEVEAVKVRLTHTDKIKDFSASIELGKQLHNLLSIAHAATDTAYKHKLVPKEGGK